jgi:hypothetical protein
MWPLGSLAVEPSGISPYDRASESGSDLVNLTIEVYRDAPGSTPTSSNRLRGRPRSFCFTPGVASRASDAMG